MAEFGPERPADWLTAGKLRRLPETLFFHARDKLAAALQNGHFRLMTGLAERAQAAGLGVELVTFSPRGQEAALADPRHLHIFMDDRPAYGPNIFHSVPSYLHGFWYFEEVGTRNNALMRLAKFDPRPMSVEYARDTHAQLVQKFVTANRTKFDQLPRGAEPVEPGCLAFFAQDFKPPRYHRHYLEVPQMIEAAIAAKGSRPLYIKPHPNQTLEEMDRLTGYHDPSAGVIVTQASIHDLLAAADCVLTVTSAVGFEAFLHKKPVVLAGQTDFWQNAVTLTDPAKLGEAMEAAMGRHWPHEKFLVWYLRHQCVEDLPGQVPKILERVYRKGFAWADPARGFF